MTKTSTSFVCERFANLLLKIENNQFRVLHPVFSFCVFTVKIRVTTAKMLCMHDTPHEEDV